MAELQERTAFVVIDENGSPMLGTISGMENGAWYWHLASDNPEAIERAKVKGYRVVPIRIVPLNYVPAKT